GRVAGRHDDRVHAEGRDAERVADLAEARALAHVVQVPGRPAVARADPAHAVCSFSLVRSASARRASCAATTNWSMANEISSARSGSALASTTPPGRPG